MRKLAFILVPLLVLACNREPAAPELPVLSASLTATSEWIYWDIGPFANVDFGPVSCLGDAHGYAFGGVSGRSRWVTRPDGSVVEKWWTLTLWDGYYIVVAGEKWWPSRWGAADEAGASNLITPEKVLDAVELRAGPEPARPCYLKLYVVLKMSSTSRVNSSPNT